MEYITREKAEELIKTAVTKASKRDTIFAILPDNRMVLAEYNLHRNKELFTLYQPGECDPEAVRDTLAPEPPEMNDQTTAFIYKVWAIRQKFALPRRRRIADRIGRYQ